MSELAAKKSTSGNKSIYTWKLKANQIGDFLFGIEFGSSIQVAGKFNGAVCQIQGTNNINFQPSKLFTTFEGDFDFTKPLVRQLPVTPLLLRPAIIGGDAATEMTIIMVSK